MVGAVGSMPSAVRGTLPGRADAAADDPGRRVQALTTHLLGEAHDAQQRELDGRSGHERAPTAGALQAPLADQVGERPPDGDEAATVLVGQLALGWQPVARLPLPGVEGTAQVQVHLVVQGHRTRFQSTTRHG